MDVGNGVALRRDLDRKIGRSRTEPFDAILHHFPLESIGTRRAVLLNVKRLVKRLLRFTISRVEVCLKLISAAIGSARGNVPRRTLIAISQRVRHFTCLWH